jgi:hypothetical protein
MPRNGVAWALRNVSLSPCGFSALMRGHCAAFRVTLRPDQELQGIQRLAGGPRWIFRTDGPVCSPHVPENACEFASETPPEKNSTASLHALAACHLLRDIRRFDRWLRVWKRAAPSRFDCRFGLRPIVGCWRRPQSPKGDRIAQRMHRRDAVFPFCPRVSPQQICGPRFETD